MGIKVRMLHNEMGVNKSTNEIIRFGIVGVVATIFHYVIYWLLLKKLPVNIAYTIGYVLSFLCNFVLTSYFTFKVHLTLARLLRFGLSHVLNWLVQICLLNILLCIGVSKMWVPVPVILSSFPICFFMTSYAMKHVSHNYKEIK